MGSYHFYGYIISFIVFASANELCYDVDGDRVGASDIYIDMSVDSVSIIVSVSGSSVAIVA